MYKIIKIQHIKGQLETIKTDFQVNLSYSHSFKKAADMNFKIWSSNEMYYYKAIKMEPNE